MKDHFHINCRHFVFYLFIYLFIYCCIATEGNKIYRKNNNNRCKARANERGGCDRGSNRTESQSTIRLQYLVNLTHPIAT